MRSIRLLRVMMWSRAAPCEKKKSVEEFLKMYCPKLYGQHKKEPW